MSETTSLNAGGDACEGDDIRQDNSSQMDLLGPQCEVGLKLRTLYASLQDESIPDRLLDLLEKLAQVEQESVRDDSVRSVG